MKAQFLFWLTVAAIIFLGCLWPGQMNAEAAARTVMLLGFLLFSLFLAVTIAVMFVMLIIKTAVWFK